MTTRAPWRRNSARSLIAEAFLNKAGRGRFRAYGAGVEPAAAPETNTIEMLRMAGFPTDTLRPKHYTDFAGPSALLSAPLRCLRAPPQAISRRHEARRA